VPDHLVRELARLVDAPTDQVLMKALLNDQTLVALEVDDRERILRALEDCPDELAELRGVLLREHEWRLREGLV
jgi:hypothetical protein